MLLTLLGESMLTLFKYYPLMFAGIFNHLNVCDRLQLSANTTKLNDFIYSMYFLR